MTRLEVKKSLLKKASPLGHLSSLSFSLAATRYHRTIGRCIIFVSVHGSSVVRYTHTHAHTLAYIDTRTTCTDLYIISLAVIRRGALRRVVGSTGQRHVMVMAAIII